MGSVDGALEHVGEEIAPNLAGLPSVRNNSVQLLLHILLAGAALWAVEAIAELSSLAASLQAVEQILMGQLSLVLGVGDFLLDVTPLGSQVGNAVGAELGGEGVIEGGKRGEVVSLSVATAISIFNKQMTLQLTNKQRKDHR